jgi:endonuclease/exonuclease/phosphatase family metal-dependent hydrolase
MLRFLIWVAQATLLALLLAALAARYVHPREASWLQVIALAMPAFVTLAVLAAIANVWAREAVGGALWLVVLALVAPRYITWPDRAGPQPSLRVLSFNVDDTYLGQGDRRPIEAVLEQNEPHLVALQEAKLEWFSTGNGEHSVFLPLYLTPLLSHPELRLPPPDTLEGRTPQRLPLFTSLPWAEYGELDVWGEDDGTGPRSTGSRSVVVWEGQAVAVYNVHLRSFGPIRPWRQGQRMGLFSPATWRGALAAYRRDFIARAEDAEQLRRLLDAEPLPYLLVGDLNSTPHHWVYGHLARAGLRDVHRVAGRGWGGDVPR